MDVLAVIPARCGSKGVPNKNIINIDGKPMIEYSIEVALASRLITRTIVSTDSEHYMKIARECGAEAPFLRPAEFARDESLDIDVFIHMLSWLRDNENYIPDICVHLRPCAPIRNPVIVDDVIKCLIDKPKLDSIRTIARSSATPYKMWHLSDDMIITPVITHIHECYNMPRQSLPQTYYITGYVDAVRSNIISEQRSMTGNSIGGYVLDEYFNIDYPEDINFVEFCIKVRNKKQSFLIDVEGTLLDEERNQIQHNLEILNRLTNYGHSVYLKYKSGNEKEILSKLGNPAVDGIVNKYIETDYYISNKAVNVSMITGAL